MIALTSRWFSSALASLVGLSLAVLAAPAWADKDDGDDKKGNNEAAVSEIGDDRIVEASGLALSIQHNDLVYTMNDEGGPGAKVYAVQVSSGAVVGTADISALPIEDPESITVDADGTLWLGDLGDNDHKRNDVAIYAFPEPGPGDHTITAAQRYPVTYPGGPLDVEGLLVHPTTKQVHLVTKNENGNGRLLELPDLAEGRAVQARDIGDAPGAVSDATYTSDGGWAILFAGKQLWIYNPTTWQAVGEVGTPQLEQGEGVTVERGDRTALIVSEGENSPIARVSLPVDSALTEPVDIGNSGAGDGIPYVTRDMALPLILLAIALGVAGTLVGRRLNV